MKSKVIFLVCFISFCVSNGEDEPCSAFNGEQGFCKTIFKCKPLSDLVVKTNRTQQDTDQFKKSHCGFDKSTPKVCCPEQNEPPKPPSSQCFTPDSKPGRCIGFHSCQSLVNLLQPPASTENVEYIKQSRCDGPEKYSVCCGSGPITSNIQPYNCESTVSAYPPNPATRCCGIEQIQERKIFGYGGLPTAIDNYPWAVLIEYEKSGVVTTPCGGSLISGKYVLTAAHCVIGRILNLGKPKNIRLGEYDTSNEGPDCQAVEAGGTDCTEGVTRIPVEKTIPHPKYDPNTVEKWNDIALIRMTEMAPYTDFIRPICLPSQDYTLGKSPFNAILTGWGAVNETLRSSPIKLHVELPFVTKNECQQVYRAPGRNVTLLPGQFCAGGEKGKDSCKGDSGSPLMFKTASETYQVIGIVSFGHIECGLENIPAVYTNVYEYNSWIRSNIAP